MGESTTLTIRIDEDIKRALENAAVAEDRSVTDFVIRSVKARMAPQCLTCGRSEASAAQPAGLSAAFDAFLDEVRAKNRGLTQIVITTIELGHPRAYRGRLALNEDQHGAVMLELVIAGHTVTLPVPRGLITGWGFDQQGEQHRRYLALGYVNGSVLAEMLLYGSKESRKQR